MKIAIIVGGLVLLFVAGLVGYLAWEEAQALKRGEE